MIQFSAPGKYVPPNRREGQDCVFHLANGGWEWLFDWDHVKRSGYREHIRRWNIPDIEIGDKCPKCFWQCVHLIAKINSAGDSVIFTVCANCFRRTSPSSLSYQKVKLLGYEVDDIPVIANNACESCEGSGCIDCTKDQCAHCGGRNRVQAHHPYRRSVIRMTGKTSWYRVVILLCRRCHQELHSDERKAA